MFPQATWTAVVGRLLLVLVVVFQAVDSLVPPKLIQASLLSSSSTESISASRRSFLQFTKLIVWAPTIGALPSISTAASASIPMVSTEEFSTIVRDSARSIDRVEFSGPKSELVLVRLVDGTTFGIRDVVESSIDPRSPLKIAATCKANGVSYAFVDIEAFLSSTTRQKKVYANARVLEAAEKEKQKALRMQEDEALRQEELAEMQSRNR